MKLKPRVNYISINLSIDLYFTRNGVSSLHDATLVLSSSAVARLLMSACIYLHGRCGRRYMAGILLSYT